LAGLTGAARDATISIEAMTKVEQIEHEVQTLTDDELGDFRNWFAEFDARVWDRQFEDDVQSGKLDAVADRARCRIPQRTTFDNIMDSADSGRT